MNGFLMNGSLVNPPISVPLNRPELLLKGGEFQIVNLSEVDFELLDKLLGIREILLFVLV